MWFVYNSLNYEATMSRNHYSSYKDYMLKNVKWMNAPNQMERATIKSIFITNIKKIHDDHIDENMLVDEHPTEEPTTNIIDEQPEEPTTNKKWWTTCRNKAHTEEPTTNIIDEQPEEPEQPTHEPTSNIIDKTINANNEKPRSTF